MYSEEELTKLKYGEIIEISRSFDVYKSKSKKVDLIQRILKAQEMLEENSDQTEVDDRLPTGPVECDDSRRGTFVIESPADSKPVEKRAKKALMPVLNESEEELFDNNVPEERPEPRRTRRATFTTAKKMIESQRVLRSRKTEQFDETVEDRRETFIVEQKPTRGKKGKKKISILPEENECEEEPTEEETQNLVSNSEPKPSFKREGTFEITEVAVEDVEGPEITENKNEEEAISEAKTSMEKKAPSPIQRQRTFEITDDQKTTESVPTRHSLRRGGTFEIIDRKPSREISPDENKLVDVSELKTYVPEVEAQPVHKMSIFERLHANVSLVERKSFRARNSTQLSEKKASRKFSAKSATPLKKLNPKLSTNMTPKERKQSLLAVKDLKNQRFNTPRQNGLTPKPSSAIKEVKCRTPFSAKTVVKGKTPEAKSKIPFIARKPLNFAAIHKANFDNMESIADHKERVAKRAETLFSPAKGPQKLFNVTLDAPRVSHIPVKKERSFVSKAPPTNMNKIREKQKDFLKGVRVNRRFLLQMERKNQ